MPIYTGGNVYLSGAQPFDKEENYAIDTEHPVTLELTEENGQWKLNTNLYDILPKLKTPFVSTALLGEAFEPEQLFENPDGSEILFNEDYFGEHRAVNPTPGPFENSEELTKNLFEC